MNKVTDHKTYISFHSDSFGNLRVLWRKHRFIIPITDLCQAIDIINSNNAFERVDDSKTTIASFYPNDSIIRPIFLNCLTIDGVYAFLSNSKKKKAKDFAQYFDTEVMPHLRSVENKEDPDFEDFCKNTVYIEQTDRIYAYTFPVLGTLHYVYMNSELYFFLYDLSSLFGHRKMYQAISEYCKSLVYFCPIDTLSNKNGAGTQDNTPKIEMTPRNVTLDEQSIGYYTKTCGKNVYSSWVIEAISLADLLLLISKNQLTLCKKFIERMLSSHIAPYFKDILVSKTQGSVHFNSAPKEIQIKKDGFRTNAAVFHMPSPSVESKDDENQPKKLSEKEIETIWNLLDRYIVNKSAEHLQAIKMYDTLLTRCNGFSPLECLGISLDTEEEESQEVEPSLQPQEILRSMQDLLIPNKDGDLCFTYGNICNSGKNCFDELHARLSPVDLTKKDLSRMFTQLNCKRIRTRQGISWVIDKDTYSQIIEKTAS